jgi:3-deoxy-D-manno-octulosonic acid kinase
MQVTEYSHNRGGIVYDAQRIGKPEPALFTRAHWLSLGGARELQGGRGGVLFVPHADQRWVLRHYNRGGIAAKVLTDSYLWKGASRCRSFREWRLLATLREKGLPVPAPIAAQYLRHGLFYTADLLTEEIPDVRELAAAMADGSLTESDWRATGATVAMFHRHGVHHVDLNAHNILVGASQRIYMLDFDRGLIQARGAWEQRVLERLHRSLRKVWSEDSNAEFGDRQWDWLMEGYADSGQ